MSRRSSLLAAVAVGLMTCGYAAYFSYYTCLRHFMFRTYAYDLGTFDQGIWLAGHSTDPFVTVRGLHLLGDHVRVFAYVLAPIYWIWDDVRFLLILQSVAIAAGAVFLYLLGRRELPRHPFAVAALCASYLLNPAVQNLNLDHAHPDAFAQTLILASVYFLRTSRNVAFAIAAAMAMSCKEDVPLVYVGLGLWTAASGQWRLGLATTAVAAAYFWACLFVILPHFNGQGFFRMGSGNILGDTASRWYDPIWLLPKFFNAVAWHYYFLIGLPLAFLFILTPTILVAAAPAIAANLLSQASYQRMIDYHYTTSIVPFLYVATLWSLRKLADPEPIPLITKWTGWALAAAPVTAIAWLLIVPSAVIANAYYSKAPIRKMARHVTDLQRYRLDARDELRRKLLEMIPPDAVVAADYQLLPHLSHRPGIYMFPNPFRAWNWGIRNENAHDTALIDYVILTRVVTNNADEAIMEAQVEAGAFEQIAGGDAVVLFQRVRVQPGIERGCGDWTGDGLVAKSDARAMGAGLAHGQECPAHVCDVDGNGVVNLVDVARLNRYVEKSEGVLACPATPR